LRLEPALRQFYDEDQLPSFEHARCRRGRR
jgi:hypothetical protein